MQGEGDDGEWSDAGTGTFAFNEDPGDWIHSVLLGLGHHADLFHADAVEHGENLDHKSILEFVVGFEIDGTWSAAEFDAHEVEKGPVCTLWLEQPIPPLFHSWFEPKAP